MFAPGESLDLLIGPWLNASGTAFQVLLCSEMQGSKPYPPKMCAPSTRHWPCILWSGQGVTVRRGDRTAARAGAQSEQALAAIAQLLLKTPARHMGRLAESLFVFPEMASQRGSGCARQIQA